VGISTGKMNPPEGLVTNPSNNTRQWPEEEKRITAIGEHLR
jgi:hypothetical protein